MAGESPAAILFDAEGNAVAVQLADGAYKLQVEDRRMASLMRELGEIKDALKAITAHLALLTEKEF